MLFQRKKDVSVIIPAHNAANYIGSALQSCLGEVPENIEVIVCDDLSTDDTCAVIKKIPDSKVKLLRNDTNLGPGPSRDRAITVAQGEWIALMDADDAWASERLNTLLSAAAITGADVIFDDIQLCHDTENGMVPWRSVHGPRGFNGNSRLTGPRLISIEDYIRAPRLIVQPMIRTNLIRQHNIHHSARRFAEDAEFILRLAHAGARFCYVPIPMYLYRITPGSLTAQAKNPSIMRQVLKECVQWPGWSPSIQSAFEDKIDSLARNEQLYALRAAVKQGRIRSVLSLLTSSPGLVFDAFRRLPGQVAYQWHRVRHGGRSR